MQCAHLINSSIPFIFYDNSSAHQLLIDFRHCIFGRSFNLSRENELNFVTFVERCTQRDIYEHNFKSAHEEDADEEEEKTETVSSEHNDATTLLAPTQNEHNECHKNQ